MKRKKLARLPKFKCEHCGKTENVKYHSAVGFFCRKCWKVKSREFLL